MNILLLIILIPVVLGIIELFTPKKTRELIAVTATFLNLILAVTVFKQEITFFVPWAFIDFSLRLYQFSSFIILAVSGFAFLVTLYSTVFMKEKQSLGQYYSYLLITLGLVNGAVLANHLVVMLFFWEALLVTLFGMIYIGGKNSYKTAIKAFLIAGVTDVCLMFGIALVFYLSGTFDMTKISIPLTTLGAIAFTLMMIGAISKAGSMPFHSWIPDAAVDAPLPFMAFLPASLEKLLGIYLLSRISLDLFQLSAYSWVSTMMMIVGVTTILLAVMMALIQKDFKKLLSYHAISQVGYMILGIGTCVPAGIVGGIFHMINHAMYKSCLFLSGGSVEKQAGTTDLNKLGGIGIKMPVTFTCFIIAAAAISGVPPFNGFFSKELVYDGALERHWIFYAGALLGSFLTAASFLKLGHAAFMGKLSDENKNVKESSWPMLVPMIVIAFGCVLFGIYNALPLHNLIQPILGEARLEGHDFAGFHVNAFLVIMTVIVLVAAYLNHTYGVKKSGKPVGASDHIHYAPVLHGIYDKAENRTFDPYDIGLWIVNIIAKIAWAIDRTIDWVYNDVTVAVVNGFGYVARSIHTGNFGIYIVWAIVGVSAILVFLV